MSKRDASLLLEDIRESIDKIARYTAGMDRALFLADEKTVDAVVRNVEVPPCAFRNNCGNPARSAR